MEKVADGSIRAAASIPATSWVTAVRAAHRRQKDDPGRGLSCRASAPSPPIKRGGRAGCSRCGPASCGPAGYTASASIRSPAKIRATGALKTLQPVEPVEIPPEVLAAKHQACPPELVEDGERAEGAHKGDDCCKPRPAAEGRTLIELGAKRNAASSMAAPGAPQSRHPLAPKIWPSCSIWPSPRRQRVSSISHTPGASDAGRLPRCVCDGLPASSTTAKYRIQSRQHSGRPLRRLHGRWLADHASPFSARWIPGEGARANLGRARGPRRTPPSTTDGSRRLARTWSFDTMGASQALAVMEALR